MPLTRIGLGWCSYTLSLTSALDGGEWKISRQLYSRENNPGMRLGGPQSWCGRFGKIEQPGTTGNRTLDRQARSTVTISTELS